MIKYIKLDSILNYVSSAVKEQTDTPQILQYANQAWRKLQLPNVQYDLKVESVTVENHKAVLPTDIKKIVGIWYTTVPYSDISYDIIVENGDQENKVVLQQQLLLSSPNFWRWVETWKPLYYLGQNKSALIDNNLYCKNCGFGFSINSDLTCLTIDINDCQLIIEYYSTLKDEDCNILIPDDSTLLEGLAAYASAMVFKEKKDRNMEGASQNYLSYLQLSQNLLNRFRGKVHLSNVQPSLHEQLRNRRFNFEGAYWKYQRNAHK